MSDPYKLSQLLASGSDNVLADWRQKFACYPESWKEPGKCRRCTVDLNEPLSAGVFAESYCESCKPLALVEKLQEEEQARIQMLDAVVPESFRYWDPVLGNEILKAKVLRFDIKSRRWMVIHGETSRCKTRAAWELFKKLYFAGNSPMFCDSADLSIDGVAPEHIKAPVLFIDDLGNECEKSSKYEARLLRLLRKRADHMRPVVITTQMTSDQLRKQFFSGTAGAAILSRLMDRTRTDHINASA